MKLKLVLIFVIIATFLSSCSKDEEEVALDYGYDYAPLVIGNYSIFQIDSIYYDDFANRIDTFHYQIKEVIDSAIVLFDDQNAFRLERFIRNNSNENWKIKDVWTVYRTKNQYVRIEENQSIIRLIFPVQANQRWDANSKNTLAASETEITKIDVASLNIFLNFNETATVVELNNKNLIERQYIGEKYAKGFGLIERRLTDLRTQVNGTIVSGLDSRQYLIESGVE